MTTSANSKADDHGDGILESVLFACLDAPDDQREAAFAAACERHPALAEKLRRSWQRIRSMQHPTGAPTYLAGCRVLRRLGGGGMGVVYLAEQEKLGRRVALKLVRSDLLEAPGMRERFQREALAASRVEHPGLCPVFEVGEADGVPFMLMPYLEGETLASRLWALTQAELGTSFVSSSSRRNLVQIVAAVARAAHHAHERGLVHRDIKPGNIMLLADGRPVLLDFGLARDDSGDAPNLTRTNERVGTPAYMAPEQIEGRPVDRRTDVYALGVVLYEVIKLEAPFRGTDLVLREQILSGVRPGSLRRGVPHDLASILLKATDPDPARRYATADELADDLQRFARMEPVRARRLGPAARSARWIRRHPVVSALLFALAVALGLAGAALRVSLHRQDQFQSLAWQGESRAAEPTDAKAALQKALDGDALDPSARSLVQIDRALFADRVLQHWDLGEWVVWVGLSPDHRRLFVVTLGGNFVAFDTETHQEICRSRPLGITRIAHATVAPDGSFVVAVGRGNEDRDPAPALLWRWQTNEVVPLRGARTRIFWSAVVSADSGTIYTAGHDGSVVRWRRDGSLDDPLPWQSMSTGRALSISLLGEDLVFAGDGGMTIVPGDGDPARFVPLEQASIRRIACAPATRRIFLPDMGVEGLRSSDGDTERLPGAPIVATSGDMSPAGDRIALGSGSGIVRLYDLRGVAADLSGIERVSYREFRAGAGSLVTVRFSADGQFLFTFSGDYLLRVFSADGEPLLQLSGFNKEVRHGLDYDPARGLLATGDGFGAVSLWDIRTRRTHPVEFRIPGVTFSGFAADSTDPLVARCTDGQLASLPLDGSEPHLLPWHSEALDDARVERGGQRVVSAAMDQTACVGDLRTGERLWSTPKTMTSNAMQCAPVGVDFLPDNRLLVVLGVQDNAPAEVQIWRIGQSDQEPPVAKWVDPAPGSSRLNHGAASPDGRHLVLAAFKNQIVILEVEYSDEQVLISEKTRISQPERVVYIDFAPQDDRFVAVVNAKQPVARIYDLDGQMLAELKGHEKWIERARFSPDGRLVATASYDGTARLWSVETGEEVMQIPVAASSPVNDVLFRADGQVLYTCSVDGLICGWSLHRETARAEAERRLGNR